MKLNRYVMRSWYYFRIGFSTYLSFVLGVANTLTVVYYLLIKNVPDLLTAFPYFTFFAFPALFVGFPLAVIIGWLHLKGSQAYSSELDIGVEANPYAYKLKPGYETEVIMPVYLNLLNLIARISRDKNLLTAKEESEISQIEEKISVLIKGGMVGTPRRRPI